MLSDDQAVITASAEGINESGRFKLQRIGNDWKIVGPVKRSENAAAK